MMLPKSVRAAINQEIKNHTESDMIQLVRRKGGLGNRPEDPYIGFQIAGVSADQSQEGKSAYDLFPDNLEKKDLLKFWMDFHGAFSYPNFAAFYDALSEQLKGGTVEDRLNEYLEQLIGQLPEPVREKISREICEEDQQRLQEMEAAKVFAAFHVREKGEKLYFQVKRSVEFLDATRALRRYLRQEPGAEAGCFAELFRGREAITAERFGQLVRLRMENTGKVAGAFDLDFDRQEFSALSIMDGWKTWSMSDVSAAAYHAFCKARLSPDQRLEHLLYRLDGREITWQASEEPEDLSAAVGFSFGEGPTL